MPYSKRMETDGESTPNVKPVLMAKANKALLRLRINNRSQPVLERVLMKSERTAHLPGGVIFLIRQRGSSF